MVNLGCGCFCWALPRSLFALFLCWMAKRISGWGICVSPFAVCVCCFFCVVICQPMWKSRDPSYLRDATRKPWGRQQGRKTQQHNKKKPSTQTHSPSLSSSNFCSSEPKETTKSELVSCPLLWLLFEPSLARFEPWDEKCATAHASLVACLLTPQKKTLFSASAKQNWHLGKHIENLFVQVVCFRFVSKKLIGLKLVSMQTKTNVSSLKFPNPYHLSFQHKEGDKTSPQTQLKLHNLHCKFPKLKGDDASHQTSFQSNSEVQTPLQIFFQLGSPWKRGKTSMSPNHWWRNVFVRSDMMSKISSNFPKRLLEAKQL